MGEGNQNELIVPEIIPKSIADVVCQKDPILPGFNTIYVKDQKIEGNAISIREFLVDKLKNDGLIVRFERGSRSETLVYTALIANKEVIIDASTMHGDQICHFSCQTKGVPNRRGYVQKFYTISDTEYEKYKNLGIMQIATSLAIEAIKADPSTPTDVIGGEVTLDNISSLLSRLHIPNLTEGGYYLHKITPDGEGWNLLTYIYKSATLEEIKNLQHYPL